MLSDKLEELKQWKEILACIAIGDTDYVSLSQYLLDLIFSYYICMKKDSKNFEFMTSQFIIPEQKNNFSPAFDSL
jgi:hypothetical protein